jgi:hypothetical protein
MSMRSRVFEYTVLWHPNEDELKSGKKSRMIVERTTLLASDQNSANMAAVMAIPDDYKDQLDQIEVALRPF